MKFIMGIGLLFCFPACNDNKNEVQYEFEYYPERNIYYNVATSTFFYSLNGSKTWDSMHTDAKADLKALGKKEKIFTKTSEVWKDNATHLEMYDGKVYNIIGENVPGAMSAVDQVSDKKSVAKSNAPVIKVGAPAKKKGVKGFFNRMFKKKERK